MDNSFPRQYDEPPFDQTMYFRTTQLSQSGRKPFSPTFMTTNFYEVKCLNLLRYA